MACMKRFTTCRNQSGLWQRATASCGRRSPVDLHGQQRVSDFNSSPYSKWYLSARELADLSRRHQFQAETRGAFPVRQASARDAVISVLKRVAVALHLIPKTMRNKEFLKRVFFGQLVQLP